LHESYLNMLKKLKQKRKNFFNQLKKSVMSKT
jgi:hypothetical protein